MVKAATHLAAGAIAAVVLLAGAGGAVAGADAPAESAENKNDNSSASESGPAPAPHAVDNSTISTSENARAAGDEGDKPVDSGGTEARDSTRVESSEEQTEEKKPVEPDHGTSDDPDKTINRVPLRPEAPPLDLVPLPEAPLAPALETPPPADLPPAIPATPADPDTVDAIAGEAGHHPGGNEPPVLTAPVLVAPAPLPPVHILGASIAPRSTTGVRSLDPPPQGARETSPPLLRASTDEALLHNPSLTSYGAAASGQIPYRTGYNEYSPKPLAEMAAGALPGVAGLVFMTAGGICLGYRQAKTAQQLPTDGIHRFMS